MSYALKYEGSIKVTLLASETGVIKELYSTWNSVSSKKIQVIYKLGFSEEGELIFEELVPVLKDNKLLLVPVQDELVPEESSNYSLEVLLKRKIEILESLSRGEVLNEDKVKELKFLDGMIDGNAKIIREGNPYVSNPVSR